MGEIRINALGPMLLARGLLPALRRSGRPRIVNISSQIGSMVVSATMGRDVGYGASKAALNMITIKLAWRLRDDGVIAVAIHPGYLRTAMSGPGADLDPGDAAVQIVDLVDGLSIEQSGMFLCWDGSVHPW
jgi:NAD(P)-dependent dehydrogenase (short-subunit alcohol dehydrogenase family)